MTLAVPKRLQGKSPSHARARVQEQETAARVGGKLTKQSGAGFVKGDVRVKGIARIENKTTKNASFSVTVEHLQKLQEAVFGDGEIPAMQIEILSGEHKFIVMPDWALDMLLSAVRAENG